MGATSAFGFGLAVVIVAAAYFYFKGPDIGQAIGEGAEAAGKAIKEQAERQQDTLNETIINPIANTLGYETTVQHDPNDLFGRVEYRINRPHTLIFEKTHTAKDGTKTTYSPGTIFYPDGKIEAPAGVGAPTMQLPEYQRNRARAALAARRRR